MRLQALFVAVGFSVLAARPALAAPAAMAKAGKTQAALALGFDEKGVLRAAVCKQQPCPIGAGVDLKLPGELSANAAQSSLSVVRIGPDTRAITIVVPTGSSEKKWEAVVAAPLAGGSTPVVLFSGFTGLVQGVEGERRGGMVQIGPPDTTGARLIAIGEQWEELNLCGRPAMQSPSAVDPSTLKLRPAKVQRLQQDLRDGAAHVMAELVTSGLAGGGGVLRSKGATSSVGDFRAISDGKLDSAWSENRGGSGRGEYVLFDRPANLPLLGVELVFRPTGADVPHGTAPQELWLVASDRVFHVDVPKDAWQTPGARYAVKFAPPLGGDCLALVLDRAADESSEARVTVAEVSAVTQFQDADIANLVGALAGGGERAQAAADVLRTRGDAAFEAVAARLPELDEGGRLAALEILDSAPCPISVPSYLLALAGPFEGQRLHAESRLRRCGPVAAAALAAALSGAKGHALEKLADELALIAPGDAVKAFLPMMQEPALEQRRILRISLARSAGSPSAVPALRAALSDPNLPQAALLDLLRALGPRLSSFQPEAGGALARLSSANSSFRVRYLRTVPAGNLAALDAPARKLLSAALGDEPDARVRAQAARAVPAPELFKSELEHALGDPEMRVREAAARALARPSGAFASRALGARLTTDRWPIVRSAAALALAEFGPEPRADAELGVALEDPSWLVRHDVAYALGKRRVRAQAAKLRERLKDRDERFEVRAAAARALGAMCDVDSAGLLTDYVRQLRDGTAPNEVRAVALASLSSLVRLGVRDLKDRLSPLLDKNAPPSSRAAAQAALETPPGCRP
ncbi:MAG TPA: HEAT repeat domain-containing protein [Polyangiaceae bacterium]|nr:HEAT repeat domain-containing protein [Polyangiaceae bacterium]